MLKIEKKAFLENKSKTWRDLGKERETWDNRTVIAWDGLMLLKNDATNV